MVGAALVGCFLLMYLKLGGEIDASGIDCLFAHSNFGLLRLHLLLVRPVFAAV